MVDTGKYGNSTDGQWLSTSREAWIFAGVSHVSRSSISALCPVKDIIDDERPADAPAAIADVFNADRYEWSD